MLERVFRAHSLRILSLFALFALPCAAQEAGKEKNEGRPPVAKAPEWPADERLVRFEASVHRVELTAERVAQIDTNALTAQAATPAGLEKALQALGATRVLYRVDQNLDLSQGNLLSVTVNMPYVAGKSTTAGGQTQVQVQSKDIGAKFRVIGNLLEADGKRNAAVSVQVNLSDMLSSGDLGEGMRQMKFRSVEQGQNGVRLGRPAVFLTIDGAATEKDASAVAYVTRVVVQPLNP